MEITRRNKIRKRKNKRGNPSGQPGWERKRDLRVAREVELRVKGWSFHKIADEVGVTVAQVYKDIKNAFKKVDKELLEKADHLRTIELTRLDRLLEKLEEGYKLKIKEKVYGKGNKKFTIKVEERDITLTEFIYAYIRIMDRRARYISGLDAPKEVKADVGDNLKEAMETASVELLTQLNQMAEEK